MARLLFLVILVAVIVAIAAIVVSVLGRAAQAGQDALRPIYGSPEGGPMSPTPFQKVAYTALIVLLFGVATGWLGGA